METIYSFDSHRHIHTINDRPLYGTSSITSVLSKPLTWWASGKAVELMGWTNKKLTPAKERLLTAEEKLNEINGMTAREYLELLDEAYKNHQTSLNKSAEKGTDLHFELETWIKSKMNGRGHTPDPKILSFVEWAEKNVKEFLWSEVNTYSETLWVGGISDAGARLNDDRVAIIDFKSAKDAYLEHFIQCAGYGLQLKENGGFTEDGKRVIEPIEKIDMLAVVPFGNEDQTPRSMSDIPAVEDLFKAALTIYKYRQSYNKQNDG